MATGATLTGQRQTRYRRLIDMWVAPGIHPTNLDILNKLKTAEDRQFSSNMKVTGKVIDEDREERSKGESHIIGIRSDVWRPTKKERARALAAIRKRKVSEHRRSIKSNGRLTKEEQAELEARLREDESLSLDEGDVDKSRLVIKMFRSTGKRIDWRGTLEELTVTEIHNSMGSARPLATFAVILSGHDYMIQIQQNRRLWRIPPVFSFAYYDEKNDRMWYIDLKCYWVSLGIDYSIEAQGRKIGKIDGRLFALGTDSMIHIYEPSLAEDSKFQDLLSLFAASIGFQRRVRENIQRRLQGIRQGKSLHVVEDEELWLLKNPRRIAR